MNKLFLKILFTILSVFTLTTHLTAQTEAPSIELKGTELHSFQTISGMNYELSISLPRGYMPDGDEKYPVLYITDGISMFPYFYSIYNSLSLGQEVRPLIIVGIDKPSSSVIERLALRMLDLTPTKNIEEEESSSQSLGQNVVTGGADNFLKIIQSEIIPWVEENFSVSDERGLAGYSLGGLFASHVLLETPELFQNYLIGSPSLWWDNLIMFERQETFIESNLDISAHVYLSAGTEEGMMLPLMLRFSETLKSRKYENLIIDHHIFKDETHLSGIPATISRGLVSLYGNSID